MVLHLQMNITIHQSTNLRQHDDMMAAMDGTAGCSDEVQSLEGLPDELYQLTASSAAAKGFDGYLVEFIAGRRQWDHHVARTHLDLL